MAGTTFQEILSQFLEEKSPFPREEMSRKPEFHSQFTSYEPSFTWETPTAPKKFGYKISTPPHQAPRESKTENGQSSEEKSPTDRAKIVPTSSEQVWNIEKLSPETQLQIEFLTRMGANFEGKISISLLKKAHRRLARQFHPDTNQSNGEDFLRLQSIYEELSETLNSLEKTKVAA
jgi:hypothetical protein